jgi:hypothetical protein
VKRLKRLSAPRAQGVGVPEDFVDDILGVVHAIGTEAAAVAAAETPAAKAAAHTAELAASRAVAAAAAVDRDAFKARVDELLEERRATALKLATLEAAVLSRRIASQVRAVMCV